MAKGQVPKHAFKPGKSGNPNGRPKLPQDILEGRKQNSVSLGRILNRFMNMSFADLKEELANPATPALELMVGKIVAESIRTGDQTRLNFILDRAIGKVTEKVQHSGDKENPIAVVAVDLDERIKQIKGEK